MDGIYKTLMELYEMLDKMVFEKEYKKCIEEAKKQNPNLVIK